MGNQQYERALKMRLKQKRILVTGADGFIGSHLTEMLVERGAKVKALSQYNSFNYWGWLEDVDCLDDIEVLTGDVRDPHYCKYIAKDIDLIFHLAALIAIPYSYIAPDSYLDTNIKGTLNICQAALDNGCERVIHTSTSEVYGTAQYVPIDEKHPIKPQSPYSASKIAADSIALSAFMSFGLPVTIARPFNTYGPRQSSRAVIPTIMTQILSKTKSIKLGNLHPTRDFSYIEDTCRGLISLAMCDEAIGETVNIGTNSEISIGDTADLIKRLLNSDLEIESDELRIRPDKSEVERLFCDNTKIKKLTGFQPTVSFHEGLKRTIAWFRGGDNIKRYKADIYNV